MARNGEPSVSILLVDDHAVVREGYRRLLERDGGIAVIAEAGDAAAALSLFRELTPDVVVMDITMPGSSGIDVMLSMLESKPAARVLMFSMHEDTIFASRALQAGAFGYVTKASAPHVLVEAVHAVAHGRKYVSQAVAQKLALRHLAKDAKHGLSARELEVLRLLARGRTVKEIAEAMGLSAKTVANNQSAIKQKLEVDSPIELLRKAVELGVG